MPSLARTPGDWQRDGRLAIGREFRLTWRHLIVIAHFSD
jgi:hypothetical protein